MQPLRQAALCLHALSKHDQRWLLDSLPCKHRAALQGMLRELKGMGIPKDPSLIPSLDGLPLTSDIDEHQPDTPEGVLTRAEMGVVLSHLEHESDEVVAVLLGERQWPWSDALRRARPEAAREAAVLRVSATVQRTIIALLARRIEHAGVARSSAVQGSGH